MKLLAWLTDSFIEVFGITRPKPEQQRMTNLVLGGLLLTVILVAFGVVGVMVYLVSSH